MNSRKEDRIVCRTFAASEVLPLLDGPVEKVLVAVDALAADQLLHQPEDVELLGYLGELEVDLVLGPENLGIGFSAPLFLSQAQTDKMQNSVNLETMKLF